MNSFVTYHDTAGSQLNEAFTAFIAAANRLEHSHSQLHEEVAQLRAQLEERNRALASSLAENEAMRLVLRQILDTLPCGVTVLDLRKHEIALLNPAARTLLGIPADRICNWSDLPSRLQSAVETFSLHAQAGDEQEICISDSNPARWLTIRFATMEAGLMTAAQAARESRLILTFTDTTSHKQAEQEREASRNLVAMAEMAAVLAHEIRNPLGSLELIAGLLASDDGISPESRQYIQHLRAGIRSLSATLNNVLRYHSLGNPPLVPVRLSEALQSCVEFVRPLAQQNGVTLLLQESLGESKIAADASGLQQIMLNLACNALRHTPAGGKITVAAKALRQGESAVAAVEFSDTGSGIPADNLPRVFDAGFSTTRQSPGLGLTICKRIVEQHHGVISVHSQPRQGTTFRMEFPIL